MDSPSKPVFLHNTTDKKASTLTKGFFQVQDLVDYDCSFEQSTPNKVQKKFVQQSYKNEEEEFNYTKKSVRKKPNRNLKLQPLKKQNPQVIMDVGESQNPEFEHKKDEQSQRKTRKIATKMILDLSDEEEGEEKKQKSKSSEEYVQELEKSQKSHPEEENESPHQYIQKSSPQEKYFTPIQKFKNIHFSVKREKEWRRSSFHVHYQRNNEYLMSAKLTSSNTTTTFIVSKSKTDFAENGPNYLGKVKTNFMRNIVNVYGSGFNPSDVMDKKGPPRQLLATIEYETNFLGSTRPRDFQVYFLKTGVNYFDLDGTKIGNEELSLNQLFYKSNNKNKIHCFSNRKPVWNEKQGGYILNFEGRAKKASIKNFILEDETIEEEEKEVMMLGKLTEDDFRMDIKNPLSPYVGLGIALSAFETKIGCE